MPAWELATARRRDRGRSPDLRPRPASSAAAVGFRDRGPAPPVDHRFAWSTSRPPRPTPAGTAPVARRSRRRETTAAVASAPPLRPTRSAASSSWFCVASSLRLTPGPPPVGPSLLLPSSLGRSPRLRAGFGSSIRLACWASSPPAQPTAGRRMLRIAGVTPWVRRPLPQAAHGQSAGQGKRAADNLLLHSPVRPVCTPVKARGYSAGGPY